MGTVDLQCWRTQNGDGNNPGVTDCHGRSQSWYPVSGSQVQGAETAPQA